MSKAAKTASKNNPTARVKNADVFYNGQKVKPVKYMSMSRNFMAAQFENGQMALDAKGFPIPWSSIKN